jgi:hypothetical protein
MVLMAGPRYFGMEIEPASSAGSDAGDIALSKMRFWAKLTAYDGSTYYSWKEQQFVVDTGSGSPGFVDLPGGRFGSIPGDPDGGTVLSNPAREPNGVPLGTPTFARANMTYFDPAVGNVHLVTVGAAGSVVEFAKCLVTTPDAQGRYDARLQVANPDGTLNDTGASIWMREVNGSSPLVLNSIYMCELEGHSGGRPVYDLRDYPPLVEVKNSKVVANLANGVTLDFIDISLTAGTWIILASGGFGNRASSYWAQVVIGDAVVAPAQSSLATVFTAPSATFPTTGYSAVSVFNFPSPPGTGGAVFLNVNQQSGGTVSFSANLWAFRVSFT